MQEKDYTDLKVALDNIYGFKVKDGKVEKPKMELPKCVSERINFFSSYFEEGMTFMGGLNHVLAYGDHKELEMEFGFGSVDSWPKPSEEFIEWRDQNRMTDMVIAVALIYGTGNENREENSHE